MRLYHFTLLLALLAPLSAETRTEQGLSYIFEPPADHEDGKAVTLVVCCHGAGDRNTNFKSVLESHLPALRNTLRIVPQAGGPAWTPADLPKILAAIDKAKSEMKINRVVGIGFSAGGYLLSGAIFRHPDVFEGVCILGATIYEAPPSGNKQLQSRYIFWQLGLEDSVVLGSGGPGAVHGAVKTAGFSADHVRIDEIAGLDHTIDSSSLKNGYEWILESLKKGDKMTAEEKARIDELDDLLDADEPDLEAIQAIATEVEEAGRNQAMAYLWKKLEDLPGEKNEDLALLGITWAGRLGTPEAAGELLKQLKKRKKDEALYLATINSLGQCGVVEAAADMAKLLKKWEHEGKAQVALATNIALLGAEDCIPDLIKALDKTERKDDRADYTQALHKALESLTGESNEDADEWQDWLKQNARRR